MLEKESTNREREAYSGDGRGSNEDCGIENEGASTTRIASSSTANPELELLREELLRLPVTNIHSFFAAFRDLFDQLKAKLIVCEDEVIFMREDLPHKLIVLRQCRNDLLAMRSAIKSCTEKYITERDLFMRSLKEEGCDLFMKLSEVSSLERRLKELRSLRAWMLCAEQLQVAINSSDFDALFSSLRQIRDFPFEELNSEMEKELLKRKHELLVNTTGSIGLKLRTLLDDLGYPLEEHVDMQSIGEKLAGLITLLKCVRLLQTIVMDSTANGNEIVGHLFEPFKKRFHFHFYQNLKTNNDSKPEWFFTQVFTWLSVNSELFENLVEAVFTQSKEADAVRRMLEGMLVDLAVEKARSVAERVVSDSVLFSHLIDEAVAFENELKDAGYIALVGRVLAVFCEEPFLVRWLELERESCTSGVESVLMSDSQWSNRYSEVADLDLHQVPECTDQFIVLIESMTERYRWIPDVDVQARFFELQVLMLDDFRLRLVQISQQLSSPWEEPFVQLLNSFWYIARVLEEWNDAEAFIKVQMRGTSVRLRGIFDDMADMYRHVWRQRATDMALAFHQFVRCQLAPYAKLNWFSMKTTKPTDLTPAFCPFLLELRLVLGRIASSISSDSALTLYRELNEKIGDAFLQLIKATSFNYQGATQMLFDVTSSLVPLLNSLYSRSAVTTYEALDDHKFEEAVSSLRLLSVPTASALLLRSEIRKSPDEMTATILAPYDVSFIGRERALSLLEQRCDLQVDSDVSLRL
ncbi:unnamed protein product [Toxocara canis]|uniref:RAD50-interacting protein 1 n=1 Tax=Toxocara canis TaxID=6265 RepID=A0A183URL5_TOXCA|nr:unnamed protein product [Toxocara canis]